MTVSFADTLSAEASQSVKARMANQLEPSSPVAEKICVNQDRVQRASLIGEIKESDRILTNPEYRGMMGKHRSANTLRPHHLLTAVYGYYDIYPK